VLAAKDALPATETTPAIPWTGLAANAFTPAEPALKVSSDLVTIFSAPVIALPIEESNARSNAPPGENDRIGQRMRRS
jgi:hypothetical protein